jgi:hypothetical protein
MCPALLETMLKEDEGRTADGALRSHEQLAQRGRGKDVVKILTMHSSKVFQGVW